MEYKKERKKERKKETLFDPKCTIHHLSDTKLDIKQYTHTHMHRHMYINIHHRYTNNKIIIYFAVFCPGFQKGRVPSEKGTLAR